MFWKFLHLANMAIVPVIKLVMLWILLGGIFMDKTKNLGEKFLDVVSEEEMVQVNREQLKLFYFFFRQQNTQKKFFPTLVLLLSEQNLM